MAEPAFDTLTIARELERDFGYEPKQAEGAAVMIHRHLVGNVATKEDLAQAKQLLGADIQRVEDTLTAKIEALDTKIDHVEETLTAKIDHVEETLTAKIEALDAKVEAQLAPISNDLKWIKLIGGVIVAVLVLPLLRELAQVFGG
ncbi:hypothetical protein [Ruegeria sp.]|uniref:hypothetical protein n=1 Tax=Ruegeria sp. TaxID=1879320 RepID=UPI003B00CE16